MVDGFRLLEQDLTTRLRFADQAAETAPEESKTEARMGGTKA